jgi:hypothetical protein
MTHALHLKLPLPMPSTSRLVLDLGDAIKAALEELKEVTTVQIFSLFLDVAQDKAVEVRTTITPAPSPAYPSPHLCSLCHAFSA